MNGSSLENSLMLESFDSKAILIFRWHSWKSPILVGLLVVAMVVGIGGKSMIINYIARFAPRGRPINIMIMIDQIVVLVATSLLGSMVCLSLVHGNTLESLISPAGCHVFWFTIAFTNAAYACSGLAMAAWRFIVLKWEITELEAKKLMWKILALELMGMMTFVAGIGYGNYYSGTGLAYTFCRGHSTEMNTIIAEYQGSSQANIAFGIKFTSAVTGAGSINFIVELLIYWYLHVLQEKHNSALASNGVVSQDALIARHRKNVITMSSQAVTFMIECLVMATMLIMLNQNVKALEATSFPLILVFMEVTISISHIWSAPELRRFYWNGM